MVDPAAWFRCLAPPDHPVVLVALTGKEGGVQQRIYASEAVASAVAAADTERRNVYAMIHGVDLAALPLVVTYGERIATPWSQIRERCRLGQSYRITRRNADVRTIRAVILDFDGPGDLDLSKTPPPTALVATSPGRFQALWAVDHVTADDANLATYRAACLRLAEIHGGDRAVIKDLARVFRVPGSRNWKRGGAECHLISADGPRYRLADLAAQLGAVAVPAAPTPPRSGPVSQERRPFPAEALAERDRAWREIILPQLPPLKWNAGVSHAALLRAVMRAQDWGFQDQEIHGALGPWLALAEDADPAVANDDRDDPAAAILRIAASTDGTRLGEWGGRLAEHLHGLRARAVADAFWPPNEPPGGGSAPPAVPTINPPPPGAPPLPQLDGGHVTAAEHFLSSLAPRPFADVDGTLHLYDDATGTYRAEPPDRTQIRIEDHLHGRQYVSPDAPGTVRSWVWTSGRRSRDVLESVQRRAQVGAPAPSLGCAFSDNWAVLPPATPDGPVRALRPQEADRLGLGMRHHNFPLFTAPQDDATAALAAAECPPRFAAFAREALPDGLLAWFRQWVGAVLLGKAKRLEMIPVLCGPPATGKSTLLEILKRMIPDNRGITSPEELSGEYTRAELHDVRLLTMADNVDADGFALLKAIAGQDGGALARRIRGSPFVPRLICGVVMASNTIIPLGLDPTDGFWRRVCPVDFARESVAEDARRDIVGEVAEEIPDMIRWALGGAVQLAAAGWRLESPAAMVQSRREWQRRGSGFLQWWHDQESYREVGDAEDHPGTSWMQVYGAYRGDARESGHKPLSRSRCADHARFLWPGCLPPGEKRPNERVPVRTTGNAATMEAAIPPRRMDDAAVRVVGVPF